MEAYARLREPAEVLGAPMLVVATLGLLVNAVGAAILYRPGGESLNVEGALRHVIADALGSVGKHEDCNARRRELEEFLTNEYGISHTTLQVDHVGDHHASSRPSASLPDSTESAGLPLGEAGYMC